VQHTKFGIDGLAAPGDSRRCGGCGRQERASRRERDSGLGRTTGFRGYEAAVPDRAASHEAQAASSLLYLISARG
jgi:hypothetical protein